MTTALSVRHAVVHFPDGSSERCDLAPSLFREESEFTRPVAAGDRVRVETERGRSRIVEVLPRRGWLSRLRGGKEQVIVANVDQVLVVGSAAWPRFRPRLSDRLIVAAERARFEPVVVINKIDLVEDRAALEERLAVYRGMGYLALATSTTTGEGVDVLRERLRGRITAAAGPSGVGKSSLLNAIDPTLQVKTAPISDRWGKGVHTTVKSTFHPLAGGGWYVDTPGMRSFAVAGLDPADLAVFFRDLAPFVDACRFNSCTHDHEPECAVKTAVVQGKASLDRYRSYLRILRGDKGAPVDGDDEEDEDLDDEAEDSGAGDGGGEDDRASPSGAPSDPRP
ncbi:MAG TPA: ribosome small subunit-dependent GTPase A [Planctomycetota bacterium]|nr:ribosome small subunit-dependent GTPase A [Planctomycetota bacterium]